ncbi:hypothetical protein [Leptospira alstonii]|uniref:Uncharacterized protein n=2 Tax=Leptospira alstonii TaxID=28452 RepID=M6CRJ5_9LEPT|nr:hypothetical protein [Leptospira alstonii]EMJ91478.1 hypothetical protein LEP1GSC194_0643 [Leptospira alstonii serovar Sichuan str. 79601]EQA82352.1 hypothetical protein LEP1GSC193_0954 [Leptospira alstonii serovar Pingchang str. 80-412]
MEKEKDRFFPVYGGNVFLRILSSLGEIFVWFFTVIFFGMGSIGLALLALEEKFQFDWHFLWMIPLGLLAAILVFTYIRDFFLDWVLPFKIETGFIAKKEEDRDVGTEGILTYVYSIYLGEKEFFIPESCWKKLSVGQHVKVYYTSKSKTVKAVFTTK